MNGITLAIGAIALLASVAAATLVRLAGLAADPAHPGEQRYAGQGE